MSANTGHTTHLSAIHQHCHQLEGGFRNEREQRMESSTQDLLLHTTKSDRFSNFLKSISIPFLQKLFGYLR